LNPKIPGIDEFIHIKLLDEEITGKDLEELLEMKQQLSEPTSNLSAITPRNVQYG
jgi:hypothetical protein